MKIYLLNPSYFPHFGRGMRWQDTGRAGTLYYPIWLSYAAAVLEQEHEVRLVDAPAWGWSRERVLQDVAGFEPGMVVFDSSFPSLDNDISVAEGIRSKCPSATIMLVGPPASQLADRILRSPAIDAVARWEYDVTLREAARSLQNGTGLQSVAGISFKKQGRILHNPDRGFMSSEDLDHIPFVSGIYKRHLNTRHYFLGNSLYPEVQIFTGRGCPFQCTFCAWPQTLMGRKYRIRSIPNVLDEVAWIQKNLPDAKEVFFEDDTFTIEEKRVLEFSREYRKRGLKLTWSCNARVGLSYETMKTMKAANCRLLIAGFESGNDAILKSIKKGTTVEAIKRFARDARKAGILVLGDFIIGLPGETRDSIADTRRLIREIKPDLLQVSVASPFPGTEFYTWAKSGGYLLTDNPNEYLDDHGHQKAVISYPDLPAVEIVKAVDTILKGYYFSFSYAPMVLRQVWRRQGLAELTRMGRQAWNFLGYLRER